MPVQAEQEPTAASTAASGSNTGARRPRSPMRRLLGGRSRPRVLSRSRSPRFGLRDLVGEALQGAGARPGRLLIGIVGTTAGIGTLVLTMGLGATATGQVSAHFDAVAATHVEVTPAEHTGADGKDHASATLPPDALERIRGLAGIRAGALIGDVEPGVNGVTSVPVLDPSSPTAATPPVRAVSGDVLATVGGVVAQGRTFDSGHELRHDRVALLGADAAEVLGIRRVEAAPAIFIGGHAYTVVGILGEVAVDRSLLGAVIIPASTAHQDFPATKAASSLVLSIDVGAGELVSHQVPIALDPNAPENFETAAPGRPEGLQNQVRGDLDVVFLAIGLITLVAGGLGIANVTLLSVTQRRGEIGLRRALGATRRQIGAQFAVESVVVGLLGGLIGSAVAVLGVVVVSLGQGWTPVLDPLLTAGASVAGGVVGLFAGAYPAIAAARIEPSEALRD